MNTVLYYHLCWVPLFMSHHSHKGCWLHWSCEEIKRLAGKISIADANRPPEAYLEDVRCIKTYRQLVRCAEISADIFHRQGTCIFGHVLCLETKYLLLSCCCFEKSKLTVVVSGEVQTLHSVAYEIIDIFTLGVLIVPVFLDVDLTGDFTRVLVEFLSSVFSVVILER